MPQKKKNENNASIVFVLWVYAPITYLTAHTVILPSILNR